MMPTAIHRIEQRRLAAAFRSTACVLFLLGLAACAPHESKLAAEAEETSLHAQTSTAAFAQPDQRR
jgi:hypothetical protein